LTNDSGINRSSCAVRHLRRLATASFLLLLNSLVMFAQATEDDVRKSPSRPPDQKISYGKGTQQYAELRLPKGGGPFPVIAILHGGCWTGFAGAEYDAPVATALAEKGYATWNVEYRRAHETGGGWPSTFEDAERGVAALREAASKYPLDLKRVAILGHSAGGQLALYVGSHLKWPVVSLAGIADMRAFAKVWNPCTDGELLVMGGTPEDHPDRYAKVDPAELLPLGIPQVLVWGGRDPIVPESLFTGYERQADHMHVLRVPGAGHHDFGMPSGPAWEATLSAISQVISPSSR
jgi:acetyl esterase/lipase